MNLTNSNVGVGMLAMPSAMAHAGIIGGCSAWAFAMAASALSSHLLSECVAALGFHATVSQIAEAGLGLVGKTAVESLIIFGIAGASIGYLVVIGDTMPGVAASLGGGVVLQRREVWIVGLAISIIAPLT